ncbi:MAG: MBL fold metallo-hydrolase, partial [Alphaproteobacteria bacterium]
MARTIAFIADQDTRPGVVYRPAPGLRRLVAPNAGPFTYTGTGTYIVGEGDVAVIDPGPAIAGHIAALSSALAGERVGAILVTHTHRDHSPAARALGTATGAPVIGCAPLAAGAGNGDAEEGLDAAYRPDRVLQDGEEVRGDGWT